MRKWHQLILYHWNQHRDDKTQGHLSGYGDRHQQPTRQTSTHVKAMPHMQSDMPSKQKHQNG